MQYWHTWLTFLGLILGLIAPVFVRMSVITSALIGLAAGAAVAVAVNMTLPPPPCLQNAKGWDILRAYDLKCPQEQR